MAVTLTTSFPEQSNSFRIGSKYNLYIGFRYVVDSGKNVKLQARFKNFVSSTSQHYAAPSSYLKITVNNSTITLKDGSFDFTTSAYTWTVMPGCNDASITCSSGGSGGSDAVTINFSFYSSYHGSATGQLVIPKGAIGADQYYSKVAAPTSITWDRSDNNYIQGIDTATFVISGGGTGTNTKASSGQLVLSTKGTSLTEKLTGSVVKTNPYTAKVSSSLSFALADSSKIAYINSFSALWNSNVSGYNSNEFSLTTTASPPVITVKKNFINNINIKVNNTTTSSGKVVIIPSDQSTASITVSVDSNEASGRIIRYKKSDATAWTTGAKEITFTTETISENATIKYEFQIYDSDFNREMAYSNFSISVKRDASFKIKYKTSATQENYTEEALVTSAKLKEFLNTTHTTDDLYEILVVGTPTDIATESLDASYLFRNRTFLTKVSLKNWNTDNVTNADGMFSGCLNLSTVYLPESTTFSPISVSGLFLNCEKLEDLSLGALNTSNIINMYAMFRGCKLLQNIDTTSFNTANVILMGSMFEDCESLLLLDLTTFRTPNVTNMSGLFKNCKLLSEIDLSNFNTELVQNMSGMFEGCEGLADIDVSLLNTKEVTNMSAMFKNCSMLYDLDLDSFNTEKVEDFSQMFYGCEYLSSLSIRNFSIDALSENSDTLKEMFYSCQGLKYIVVDVNSDWSGAPSSISGENMFKDCYFLPNYSSSKVDKTYAKPSPSGYFFKKLDILLNINYKTLEGSPNSDSGLNASALTGHSVDLIQIPTTDQYVGLITIKYIRDDIEYTLYKRISSGTSDWTKDKMISLKGKNNIISIYCGTSTIGSFDNYSYNDSDVLFFKINLSLKNLDSIKTYSAYNEISLSDKTNIESITLEGKSSYTSSEDSLSSKFSGCTSLITADLSLADLTYVTAMDSLFEDCSSLESVVFSETVERNINCSKLFKNCTSLTSADLSMIDTESTNGISELFYGCTSIKTIDLSNFTFIDTSEDKTYNFSGIFYNCENLETIYAGVDWLCHDIIVTETLPMFYGCNSLRGAISYVEGKDTSIYANSIDGYFYGPSQELPVKINNKAIHRVRTWKVSNTPDSSGEYTKYDPKLIQHINLWKSPAGETTNPKSWTDTEWKNSLVPAFTVTENLEISKYNWESKIREL